MDIVRLNEGYERLKRVSKASRLRRMLFNPWRYLSAIFFREIIYRLFKAPLISRTRLFYGKKFFVKLPSGTDIYITGGKSDDSELRLAKFIIRRLPPAGVFFDIGAHFGYYTLLASACVGKQGTVVAFEGSKDNFKILSRNASMEPNILCLNKIVCEHEVNTPIYEFPPDLSEYNSLYPEQFRNQPWFNRISYKVTEAEGITLDGFCLRSLIFPDLIKIDAEGSEYDILRGAKEILRNRPRLLIAMEYLSARRQNLPHQQAMRLLLSNGFSSFSINSEGDLVDCPEPDRYLEFGGLESDNLVFVRHVDN